MKYVKVLGLLDKKKRYGYYSHKRNEIVVDFSQGIPTAILTSYHEILHKIFSTLQIQDFTDIFSAPISREGIKNPKLWLVCLKAIFEKPQYIQLARCPFCKGYIDKEDMLLHFWEQHEDILRTGQGDGIIEQLLKN